jgi:predicted RNA-binding protein with PUA-like domain
MNYWLVKFAPFRVSWQEILHNGSFEIYSVRNHQARNNLKAMKLNDVALFYHSQKEKRIMGSMKIIEEAHQDKTTSDPQWLSVTFEPIESFTKPISLKQIIDCSSLQNIGLIKQPRLAVMEITPKEYKIILTL